MTEAVTTDVQAEIAKSPEADAPTYFRIASRYKSARQELAGLTPKDSQLENAVRKFAKELGGLSTSTEQYATTIQDRANAGPEELPRFDAQLEDIRQKSKRAKDSYTSALDKLQNLCAPK